MRASVVSARKGSISVRPRSLRLRSCCLAKNRRTQATKCGMFFFCALASRSTVMESFRPVWLGVQWRHAPASRLRHIILSLIGSYASYGRWALSFFMPASLFFFGSGISALITAIIRSELSPASFVYIIVKIGFMQECSYLKTFIRGSSKMQFKIRLDKRCARKRRAPVNLCVSWLKLYQAGIVQWRFECPSK